MDLGLKTGYLGHPPKSDAELLASIELVGQNHAGFNHWQLWMRVAASKPPWISLKLISVRRRKHKANFWLAWNTFERRFARMKDQGILVKQDPSGRALILWMERELVKKFTKPSTVRLVKRGR